MVPGVDKTIEQLIDDTCKEAISVYYGIGFHNKRDELLARYAALEAQVKALVAEIAILRYGIDEAIENCETCRGETDQARKCARCRTFANLLWPPEVKP